MCLPRCPPQASTGRDTWEPSSSTWNTVLYLGSTGRMPRCPPQASTGRDTWDARLIYMEYCSVPGVHGQNGNVCPGVHHRLPRGGTHGRPAHLHGILFCTWGSHVEWACLSRCPPQASTWRDTWAPSSSAWNSVLYLEFTCRMGASARMYYRLPRGGTHGRPAHLHGILFCTWGPRVNGRVCPGVHKRLP